MKNRKEGDFFEKSNDLFERYLIWRIRIYLVHRKRCHDYDVHCGFIFDWL